MSKNSKIVDGEHGEARNHVHDKRATKEASQSPKSNNPKNLEKGRIVKCTQCGYEQDADLHDGLWCDDCGDVRIYGK